MEKSEEKSSIWGWIVPIFLILLVVALLLPAVGGMMHLFKVYGPGMGLTVLILLPLSLFSILTPISTLIFDIIAVKEKRKIIADKKEKADSDEMFDMEINSMRSLDKMYVVKGDFIDIIYYPNHKKVRWGYSAVPLLLMFMAGVKGCLILFFSHQIMADTHLYMPWNY